jgi:hypothetical protein
MQEALMPFRFRRSIRIAPDIRLNVSKSGLSTTVGRRGAHVTIGHGHTRTTVGIPGTGVSYTTTGTTEGNRRRTPAPPLTWGQWLLGVVAILGLALWLGWR